MNSPNKLQQVADVVYEVDAPFTFITTIRKPSHFPTPLELFDGDTRYLFLADVAGTIVGCEATRVSNTAVRLRLYSSAGALDADATVQEIERRLGLRADLRGLPELWNRDPLLAPLPRTLLGGRPSAPHSLYGFLIICVVLQNTAVRRTVQMMDALIGRFSKPYEFPGGEMLPALWGPHEMQDVSEEEIRALKLGYRAKTIKRLSEQFTAEPQIEHRLLSMATDDELAGALATLYGVGPATGNYVMYEWFKSVDHLVHISPWETKILSRLIFGEEGHGSAELMEHARERWSPYSMQAVHAIFESVFWRRAGGEGPAWLDELISL